jgi:hypothetical protein
MNDIGARLALVLASMGVAMVVILMMRGRAGRRRPIRIRQAKLGRGVYLFTSAECSDCATARRVLVDTIGPSGFIELSWESEPEIFRDLGVEAVPATLIVSESDSSTLYPGLPDRAVESLGP